MNNELSGQLIMQKRKNLNLTQSQLAEKLNVSEKTISKWECGKGFPDTSLILPLCDVLGITANELLSGKTLKETEYKTQSENNIIKLLEEKNINKKRMIFGVSLALSLLFASFAIMLLTAFAKTSQWFSIALILVSLVVLIVAIIIACKFDRTVGTFECRHCHKRFVPTLNSYIWGVHSITTRFLKCPYCGKRSFCKKRLSK